MSINYTPRTWVSGETVTAAYMNTEIRDALTGIQAAWTAYTPTLTGSTTNPTGQSYSGSAYIRDGKTVHCRALITLAATTGSGAYAIAGPVTANGVEQTIRGIITDQGTGWYETAMRFNGAGTWSLLTPATTAGAIMRPVAATVPMTFAVNDQINVEGSFESA